LFLRFWFYFFFRIIQKNGMKLVFPIIILGNDTTDIEFKKCFRSSIYFFVNRIEISFIELWEIFQLGRICSTIQFFHHCEPQKWIWSYTDVTQSFFKKFCPVTEYFSSFKKIKLANYFGSSQKKESDAEKYGDFD
jgi:hypothetical protein